MSTMHGPALVSVGKIAEVHTSAKNPVGTVAVDGSGNEYIYLKGVASTVVGSWVTYDETFQTALLAANAVGPVAVAQAATVADRWGFYCIRGVTNASMAANSADNSAAVGREGADGVAGDGRAAGDAIIGAVARAATTSAAVVAVQLNYPFVNDATGA